MSEQETGQIQLTKDQHDKDPYHKKQQKASTGEKEDKKK
jgi:hypothetical protein